MTEQETPAWARRCAERLNGRLWSQLRISVGEKTFARLLAEEFGPLVEAAERAQKLLYVRGLRAALARLHATPDMGPNHADGCDGAMWRYSGEGYNRVRLCACGAEDHAPDARSGEEAPDAE